MQIYNLMTHGGLAHALVLILAVLMLIVIVHDTVRYTIPNTLNLAVLALYGVAIFFLPIHPLSGLAAAGLTLFIGLGIFALGLMGGGDIKLLVVLTLWTGWIKLTLQFVFLTAIFGGLLVILVLLLRAIAPMLFSRKSPGTGLPRLLTRGQPVPYGVAIALAFLYMLLIGGIPGLTA